MDGSNWVRRVLWIGLGLAVLAGLIWMRLQPDKVSYTDPPANPSFRTDGVYAMPAAQRPAMDDLTFHDARGQRQSLDRFAGQVTLVNLWATWCPPCVAEMPDLNTLQQTHSGPGFHVVAISVDQGGVEIARRWFQRHAIDALPLYAANPDVVAGGVLPTSYLLDKQGRVAWMGVGMQDWTGPETAGTIQALLQE